MVSSSVPQPSAQRQHKDSMIQTRTPSQLLGGTCPLCRVAHGCAHRYRRIQEGWLLAVLATAAAR